MPPAFLFPEMDHLTREAPSENGLIQKRDEVDKALNNNVDVISNEKMEEGKEVSTLVSDVTEQISSVDLNGQDGQLGDNVLRRSKKGNLKQGGKAPLTRRVSFDPLALLLDASLEGELELVKKTATQVTTLQHKRFHLLFAIKNITFICCLLVNYLVFYFIQKNTDAA